MPDLFLTVTVLIEDLNIIHWSHNDLKSLFFGSFHFFSEGTNPSASLGRTFDPFYFANDN